MVRLMISMSCSEVFQGFKAPRKKAPRMGRCAVGILGLCTLILLQGVVGKVSISSENGTEFVGKFPIYRVYERPGKDGVEFEFSDEHPLDMRPGDSEVWEAAGILVTLSETGLTYVKEVLVNRILEEITPLALPDIKVRTNSPIGHVDMEITKIELSGANVSYSDLDLGKAGITVFAGDIQAKLRLHWYYEYSATYVPFPINDGGWADVKVHGMQAGVTFSLMANNGTIQMKLVESGTYIDSLDIQLHGGASWLYQWFVYAFDEEIRDVIEAAISKQMATAVEQLDTYLEELPRYLPIDNTSAINVTINQDPFVSPVFLSVGIKGDFVSLVKPTNFTYPDRSLPLGLFCSDSAKMITITVCDYVINSATAVYYEAGHLEWLVDELPQESWLNTHFWRWILPQLYKKYPSMDMALNFACSVAPMVQLNKDGATATAAADLTLLVKSDTGPLPVACIGMAISMDVVIGLKGNNITGEAMLNDLGLELKWSDIGKFPVNLLQPTLRTIVSKVIIPLLNVKLGNGFPLPVIPAVNLENADIRYEEGYIFICSDVHYKGGLIKSIQLPANDALL